MEHDVDLLREENAALRRVLATLQGIKAPIEGLSPLESKLVNMLRKANGRVLTHQMLLDGLYWDRPDAPGSPNLLSVVVGHVRKKRPDYRARIQSVFGVGYRWE